MTIHLCKSLIFHSLKNPAHLIHKPYGHGAFSLSVLFFSSLKEKTSRILNPKIIALLRKHDFSSEAATTVAYKLAQLKIPQKYGYIQKWDSVLSFLKDSGFSRAHLETLVKKDPQVISLNLDKSIKPKIKILQDLGFLTPDIADIISVDPWILGRSANNAIAPSVMVLRNLLGSTSEVAKVLRNAGFGVYLKCDLEKTMVPNIQILESCGISKPRIIRNIYIFPRFLTQRPQRMKKFVEKLEKLGCDPKSKMLLHALRSVASMSPVAWELKWDAFRDLGFSEDKVLSMFQRRPQAFSVSCRKIKETVNFFLDSGAYNLEDIFDQPEVLTCSIEKRLKPRLNALQILETRNLLKQWPSLSTLYKTSNSYFLKKFIFPYVDEVDEFNLLLKGAWAKDISQSDYSR
ncbi:uncharacterized protein [Coffea arabica]|uniref:Uncharacterized protein n=1 Tax=Coffea arabica TaxID=13443 RepID=A0ABM4W001_COFAR